jgi:hypothetical protein
LASKLSRGFPIEQPAVAVPWGISEAGFVTLLGDAAPARVTAGHYRLQCRILGGLDAALHFHFRPTGTSTLAQVEFLRTPRRHRQREFDDLEARLVALLGPRDNGRQSATMSCWTTPDATVTHSWYYYGGEYEKVLFTGRRR